MVFALNQWQMILNVVGSSSRLHQYQTSLLEEYMEINTIINSGRINHQKL
ncbi:hypothetical protein [Nostoc sp. CHAB 5715]|nr:hypothetical protein [Nostoc sp. CHAB 5715]MCC5622402.1 hypothetical protein [Nostoc sp. CHAB 5715]